MPLLTLKINMFFMRKISYLSLCVISALYNQLAVAQSPLKNTTEHIELEPIFVNTLIESREGAPLSGRLMASEKIIPAYSLKQRGSNLGDALSSELGIHASQFGGGASAPVIRGQEGKRIKVLSSGNETLDMSAMSPDHAVAVDSLLAKKVEILRGANTLLYSSGNAAGVVNVVDNKIPTAEVVGVEGEVGLRTGSADDERLVNVALDVGLSKHFALHLEGLHKKAGDYRTPSYQYQGSTHHKLANSFVDNRSGSVGLSWVGDKGYLGVAYSQRKDKYGLPAHSHLYDEYYMHVLLSDVHWRKPYLKHYPFLMEETDIDYNNPGIDCIKKEWHSHGHLCNHGHAHHGNGQHSHDHHAHADPHIALNTQRWDLRGEWKNPVKGLDKVRFSIAKVGYRHDEKSGAISDNSFKNKGYSARVEFLHQPIAGVSGLIGLSHVYQDSYALDNHTLEYRKQNLLSDHTTAQQSLFLMEHVELGKWQFDIGWRVEKQRIAMKYHFNVPKDERPPEELTRPHKSKAYSYALSANYQLNERHQFNMIVSHQERLPNAQELYAHGKHLATNSFEAGNKNLTKERSNNVELGWGYTGEKLGIKLSGYYQQFSNYIYAAILNNKTSCPWRPNSRCLRSLSDDYPLRLYRYNQAKAKIYGLEAEVSYQISSTHSVSVFGDYVRGKLKDLPSLPIGYKYIYNENYDMVGVQPTGWEKQPDGNAPRMSPMRLGIKWNAYFDNGISFNTQLYRVFAQNKVARLETPTKGHTMLNLGMSYDGKMGNNEYTLFANVNNVLNSRVYNHTSFLSYIPQSGLGLNVGMNFKF
ncbi:TPA: TonB-dependent receptor [Pasteurella multocida]|nr:TonB-dependent receptor [Pasteurella multocida]HDR0734133.1 TonB-dependent receptor [Pasteurella multocida]